MTMSSTRSLPALVAAALLGVIAVAAVVTGALMFFGAWATSAALDGQARDLGTAAAILIGALTVAFGIFAALAAREEWMARPRGLVLGLTVGIVMVIAAAAALLTARTTAGTDALLGIAIAIGAATATAVLLDARSDAVAPHPAA
jgi:cytochrome bd-type quinol oxidase subunit 2